MAIAQNVEADKDILLTFAEAGLDELPDGTGVGLGYLVMGDVADGKGNCLAKTQGATREHLFDFANVGESRDLQRAAKNRRDLAAGEEETPALLVFGETQAIEVSYLLPQQCHRDRGCLGEDDKVSTLSADVADQQSHYLWVCRTRRR